MTPPVSVWFHDLHVGDVTIGDDAELRFTYSEKWRSTRGDFPLSVLMPLDAPHPHPHAVVAPWLANLLPEENQLTALTRSLGASRGDTLALLSAIGGDTAGALSFGECSPRNTWSYIPLTEFYETADPHAALESHFEDLRKRPFLAGEDGVRLSLAGGQQKTALTVLDESRQPVLRLPEPGDMYAIPLNGAPSTVILKPDNPNLPGIVENEAYCLHLAEAIGIKSAKTTIASAGARRALCVLRYDRVINSRGAIMRVHQEDFAQANAVPPGRKYERGTLPGPGAGEILQTARHLPPRDALAALDQFIFNILVANTDAHAKNYSLLHPLGGGVRLAPLYDVSSVTGWPEVNQYFAQNIAGKKRKPCDTTPQHWDAIAQAGGFRGASTRARVLALIDAIVDKRADAARSVCDLPWANAAVVKDTAERVEHNSLRIAGRF